MPFRGETQAIVFDFDGVIVESVDIKTRAFAELFRAYPRHLDRIVRFHLENAGVSRFKKFEVICREYLNEPCDAARLQQLGAQFSALVIREILRCPAVKGAERFLAEHSARYAQFIASGTPEDEIRDIVTRRGLAGFFRGVYGSPRSKVEILGAILAAGGWQPAQAVFIGDSLTDLQAAREVGVPFIGRIPPGLSNPFAGEADVVTVGDLDDLAREWPRLEGVRAGGDGRGWT